MTSEDIFFHSFPKDWFIIAGNLIYVCCVHVSVITTVQAFLHTIVNTDLYKNVLRLTSSYVLKEW